jgi:hypothetical protein
MRNKVAKKIRQKLRDEGGGQFHINEYREAKRVYKSNTQHPKFKVSRRQKRIARDKINFTEMINAANNEKP